MNPGTAGWFINILSKFPPDTLIMVWISGRYFQLSAKVDRVHSEFSKKDQPGLSFYEDFICLFLEDDRPPTPKPDKDLPQN